MHENKNEVFWGELADTYDAAAESLVGRSSRVALFNKLLGMKGLGSVVEFGCGPGYFTRAISRNASHVLATDISERMLDVARKNLADRQNVTFRKVNCENTLFPDGSFDTVFMANVIMILDDPLKAIRESFRILKDGGILILTSFTDYGMNVFDKFLFLVRVLSRFKIPPYRRKLSPDKIRSMVESAGFETEELTFIGGRVKSIFLVARKTKSH